MMMISTGMLNRTSLVERTLLSKRRTQLLTDRFAAGSHDSPRERSNIAIVHAEAAVRFGFAEAVDFTSAMNIVVGLGEEDLYLTHRVVRVAGTFLRLLFGPCGIGRDPARIPDDALDSVAAGRRRIGRLATATGYELVTSPFSITERRRWADRPRAEMPLRLPQLMTSASLLRLS